MESKATPSSAKVKAVSMSWSVVAWSVENESQRRVQPSSSSSKEMRREERRKNVPRWIAMGTEAALARERRHSGESEVGNRDVSLVKKAKGKRERV